MSSIKIVLRELNYNLVLRKFYALLKLNIKTLELPNQLKIRMANEKHYNTY